MHAGLHLEWPASLPEPYGPQPEKAWSVEAISAPYETDGSSNCRCIDGADGLPQVKCLETENGAFDVCIGDLPLCSELGPEECESLPGCVLNEECLGDCESVPGCTRVPAEN